MSTSIVSENHYWILRGFWNGHEDERKFTNGPERGLLVHLAGEIFGDERRWQDVKKVLPELSWDRTNSRWASDHPQKQPGAG